MSRFCFVFALTFHFFCFFPHVGTRAWVLLCVCFFFFLLFSAFSHTLAQMSRFCFVSLYFCIFSAFAYTLAQFVPFSDATFAVVFFSALVGAFLSL